MAPSASGQRPSNFRGREVHRRHSGRAVALRPGEIDRERRLRISTTPRRIWCSETAHGAGSRNTLRDTSSGHWNSARTGIVDSIARATSVWAGRARTAGRTPHSSSRRSWSTRWRGSTRHPQLFNAGRGLRMASRRRSAACAHPQRDRDRPVRPETRSRGLAGRRSGAPGARGARACSASDSLITPSSGLGSSPQGAAAAPPCSAHTTVRPAVSGDRRSLRDSRPPSNEVDSTPPNRPSTLTRGICVELANHHPFEPTPTLHQPPQRLSAFSVVQQSPRQTGESRM